MHLARLAGEAVEHFYAFTLDRHPTWEEHAAWATFFERAPSTREVPMWTAIAKKFIPHLKRVDHGLVDWGKA